MTNYLNERELTAIRDELLYFLPDQCYVKKKTTSVDDSGNVLETYSGTTPYYCRFITLEKLEGVFGGVAFERELSKTWYKVFFQITVDVNPGDVLENMSGEQFSVVRVFDQQSNPLIKQAMVVDMEGDMA